jgi:diphosphomevalonate decarboxylase
MVKVFAPVNIAWVKYMGKTEGGPSNVSFSMTLNNTGTLTRIDRVSDEGALRFGFSEAGYVPPPAGQSKAFSFLSDFARFEPVLRNAGFEMRPYGGAFRITTRNHVPAGTGIATSASGFAALTLAWAAILSGDPVRFRKRYEEDRDLRHALARVSATGSGSSCRSFGGPFVEWDPSAGISEFDIGSDYTDFILLLETEVKAVSSSEAHVRVRTSPGFAARRPRTEERLFRMKTLMRSGERLELARLVLEEALEMHGLFHTSSPAFRYWNRESELWIDRISKGVSAGFPFPEVALTFDAGANAHLFVPSEDADRLERYLRDAHPSLGFIRDSAGKGARFCDEDF